MEIYCSHGQRPQLGENLIQSLEAAGLKIQNSSGMFTIADDAKEESVNLARRFAEAGLSLTATRHGGGLTKQGLTVKRSARFQRKTVRKM